MSEKETSQQWDELYKGAECTWGLEPDWELRAYLPVIPKGKALDLGIREGLPVRAQVADVREFSIRKETYTCIVCAYVLTFVKRSEAEALIERIKAGLVPGGVAYVAAFSTEEPNYRRCRERGLPEVEPNTFFSAKRGMHLFYLTRAELQELFSDLELISSAEGYSLDFAHGDPHHHGWISVLAKKSPGEALI